MKCQHVWLWDSQTHSHLGEMQPHQCRVQGHNHLPAPAGHTIPDTSQDAVGLLGHLGTLLAHIQLAVNQHPQVLFGRAAFQPLLPKPVALHGVVVTRVQDPALGLVETLTVGLGPSIQPVQIPLQSLSTLEHNDTPNQLGLVVKVHLLSNRLLIKVVYNKRNPAVAKYLIYVLTFSG